MTIGNLEEGTSSLNLVPSTPAKTLSNNKFSFIRGAVATSAPSLPPGICDLIAQYTWPGTGMTRIEGEKDLRSFRLLTVAFWTESNDFNADIYEIDGVAFAIISGRDTEITFEKLRVKMMEDAPSNRYRPEVEVEFNNETLKDADLHMRIATSNEVTKIHTAIDSEKAKFPRNLRWNDVQGPLRETVNWNTGTKIAKLEDVEPFAGKFVACYGRNFLDKHKLPKVVIFGRIFKTANPENRQEEYILRISFDRGNILITDSSLQNTDLRMRLATKDLKMKESATSRMEPYMTSDDMIV